MQIDSKVNKILADQTHPFQVKVELQKKLTKLSHERNVAK
jgi:hypothetical protein